MSCGNICMTNVPKQLKKISALLLSRPGLNGAVVPADSAQPHMKETINSIQTKLDQLYNRTQVKSQHWLRNSHYMENLIARTDHFTLCGHLLAQVHDQTLLNINNHLVNGGGNELDGVARGGGNQLTTLKEEILTELERRVSLSCSACQVKLNLGHRLHQPPCVSFNLVAAVA